MRLCIHGLGKCAPPPCILTAGRITLLKSKVTSQCYILRVCIFSRDQTDMGKYMFIVGTLLLTAAGQIIIRWRAEAHSSARDGAGTLDYLLAMFLDPFVMGALAAAVIASVFWMMAVKQLPISVAYPFMALSFILVPWAASLLLNETVSLRQYLGIALVLAGVAVNAATRSP